MAFTITRSGYLIQYHLSGCQLLEHCLLPDVAVQPPWLRNSSLSIVAEEENETPGWAQLNLPSRASSPLCGHTVTSAGHHLLMFGGHGTGGWLSHYDIYYNDCNILDRGDPIAKHSIVSPPKNLSKNKDAGPPNNNAESALNDSQGEGSAVSELRKRLEVSVSLSSSGLQIVDELEDRDFLELASLLARDRVSSNKQKKEIQVLHEHWRKSSPRSIQLKELGPLLRDIATISNGGANLDSLQSNYPGKDAYQSYLIKNASQLRADDITKLLAEYKQLPFHLRPI